MKTPAGLSLKTKAALVIGLVLVGLLGGMLFILSSDLGTSFAELQAASARQQLQRVVTHLDQRAEKMLSDVTENALWDDTHDFIAGKNPGYLAQNYYAVPEVVARFDVILVWDAKGDLVESAVLTIDELRSGLPDGTTAAEFAPTAFLNLGAPRAVGLLSTSRGPLLYASAEVRRTDGSGESNGTLTYATFLEGRVLDQAARISGVDSLDLAAASPATASLPAALTPRTNILPPPIAYFSQDSAAWVTGSNPEATLDLPALGDGGQPVIIRAALSNELFDLATSSRLKMMLYPLVGGLILALTVIVLVDRLVLRRISLLTGEMQRIAESGDWAHQIAISGRDEFAALAQSANRMLSSLQAKSQALQRERALATSILQSTAESVIAVQIDPHPTVADQSLVVVRSNAAAAAFLARAPEKLHRHYLELDFPEIRDPTLHSRLLTAAESQQPFSIELAGLESRDGRWFRLSASPWEEGLVLSIHDTTQSRQIEAELRESLAEIERFNYAMMGREDRILELKAEINALVADRDQPPPYLAATHG
jgi:sensor domain CHASE-containing protein/HAMP domain-containing protein